MIESPSKRTILLLLHQYLQNMSESNLTKSALIREDRVLIKKAFMPIVVTFLRSCFASFLVIQIQYFIKLTRRINSSLKRVVTCGWKILNKIALIA